MYKVELLVGARERPKDQTMAESYVRTALELPEMSELAFFGRFSGETARVCAGFPSLRPDDVASQVFDLHQRHGQGIRNILKAAVERYSEELVNRILPPSSVLMMTLAPGGAPALAPIGMPSDTIKTWIDEAEAESAPSDRRGHPFDPKGGRANGRARKGHGKSRPALERARGAINELYPNGVPGQAVKPNAILCRQVGEKLKQAGLPDVSDDTILRAAGRRK
jgi:hypothetical protein